MSDSLSSSTTTPIMAPCAAGFHYIFGYGSLICSQSRAITAPTLATKPAIPVLVQGLQRMWSKPSFKTGMTALGIRYFDNPAAMCNGVLLVVNEQELALLDEREEGYTRRPVCVANVKRVPYLNAQRYYESIPFLATGGSSSNNSNSAGVAKDEESTSSSLNNNEDNNIWVYVQNNLVPASEVYPIAQTYVDVILRGCLEYSPRFAQDFVATTIGWDASDWKGHLYLDSIKNEWDEEDTTSDDNDSLSGLVVPSGSEDEDDEDMNMDQVATTFNHHRRRQSSVFHWVDDRKAPLYIRADVEYSQQHGMLLDKLMARATEKKAALLQNRTPISSLFGIYKQ